MSPTVIWFMIGIGLCSVEAVVPTAFIAAVMGLSAFLVAAIARFIPILGVQVGLWMVFSLLLLGLSRRFVRPSRAVKLDDTQAETLTEIAPGKVGRVQYEGCSWAAECEDEAAAIAPQQKVYVVARRGTTLIVMPEGAIRE
jgi:membrane protein implicated in regulation of membrane protease activity